MKTVNITLNFPDDMLKTAEDFSDLLTDQLLKNDHINSAVVSESAAKVTVYMCTQLIENLFDLVGTRIAREQRFDREVKMRMLGAILEDIRSTIETQLDKEESEKT